jgi:hypothetical protein
MNTIAQIKNNPDYQQILADSFGGVMYNVANRSKYNTKEIIRLWSLMTPSEQELAGGIMQGAINFLKEEVAS